jgi:hypothetical protein
MHTHLPVGFVDSKARVCYVYRFANGCVIRGLTGHNTLCIWSLLLGCLCDIGQAQGAS